MLQNKECFNVNIPGLRNNRKLSKGTLELNNDKPLELINRFECLNGEVKQNSSTDLINKEETRKMSMKIKLTLQ